MTPSFNHTHPSSHSLTHSVTWSMMSSKSVACKKWPMSLPSLPDRLVMMRPDACADIGSAACVCARVCMRMHAYARVCIAYASRMQRMHRVCTRMHAYAPRMHRVCTAYARVCTAYAPRMHRVCTAYAPRMRVCISQCRVCTPYARYPYEWLESYACDFSTQLRESNKHSTKIYQDFANERSLGGALDLEMQAPVGLAPSQREQRWHAW